MQIGHAGGHFWITAAFTLDVLKIENERTRKIQIKIKHEKTSTTNYAVADMPYWSRRVKGADKNQSKCRTHISGRVLLLNFKQQKVRW